MIHCGVDRLRRPGPEAAGAAAAGEIFFPWPAPLRRHFAHV